MPHADGYRVGRLRRRRERKVQRWQLVFLGVLAAAVAFAAVVGGGRIADFILGGEEEPREEGYVALLTFGEGEEGAAPSAMLAVRDAADGSVRLYTVPRSLLLEGPGGGYVFAGDMLAAGQLEGDLERLLRTGIDFTYRLSYEDLVTLAARDEAWMALDRPVSLRLGDEKLDFEGRAAVASGDIGALLGAEGDTGADESAVQVALTRAVLDSAALQPKAERERLVAAVVEAARGDEPAYLREILEGATSGRSSVERLPSDGRTALGQFAFHPDRGRIMAEITRRVPGFSADSTVVIRNGSGELGIGTAVAERLSALDVNLPEPTNADSFGYARTQILAGADALPLAEDVRAILGRGVVLNGAGLEPKTVMVVVGKDLTAKDLQ